MELKRKPKLMDIILSTDGHFSAFTSTKPWNRARVDALRTAKKFVLDTQATIWLAEMIRDNPRIIADAQDFAIPPFKNMWIEMPGKVFFEAVTGMPAADDSDEHIGYLFEGPKVVPAAGALDGRAGSFMPIEYILHKPMSMRQQLNLASQFGISRIGLDTWFWGATASAWMDGAVKVDRENNEEGAAWDKEALHALRNNHTANIVELNHEIPNERIVDMMEGIRQGSAGDLRNIVSLLLYLNRTKTIQKTKEFGHSNGAINKKIRPFLAHSVISLSLDPKKRLKKLVAERTGIKKRLHDVRGHFCHDEKARSVRCPHGTEHSGDFGDWWVEYEPLRWRCSECGGKRWWRHEHARGSLEEGISTAQYAVTK